MIVASQSWRQTGADVVLIAAIVTALLTLWAKVFAGPIGKWIDARIGVATYPMQTAITEMRDSNTRQHGEVREALSVVATRLGSLEDRVEKQGARLDGHIDSANEWRREQAGDGR